MLTQKDAYPELTPKSGIVGKGSWKKREIEKFQVGKSEVRKFMFKLERTLRSRKVSSEVEKFRCSWKVLAEAGKFKRTWKTNYYFPTPIIAFQLH